ncbi:MAG: GC-type dockerin domain-anchored protein [Planctomycetota bacterium]
MMRTALVTLFAAAGMASAQSAAVSLNASSASVAAGGSITVTLAADPDVGGAGSGVFGPAGLYGFGGEISLGGDRAADVTAANASILAALPSGATVSTSGAAAVRAGAGRGLDDALPAAATDLLSFDLNIDAGAADGTFTVDFDGAVVLVEGDALVTYSTDPGVNQSSLSATTLTVTIGQAGCNPADLAAPFGVLDLGDVDAFIPAFISSDPAADLVPPVGVIDLADIDAFIAAFLGGCP